MTGAFTVAGDADLLATAALSALGEVSQDAQAVLSASGALQVAGLVTDEGAGILAAAGSLTADPVVVPPVLASASLQAVVSLSADASSGPTGQSALEATGALSVQAVAGWEVGPPAEPIVVLAGVAPVTVWKSQSDPVVVPYCPPTALVVWKTELDPVLVATEIPDDTLVVVAALTGTVAR